MIVGPLKGGTTGLKSYLNEHPDVLGHPQIDFIYFHEPEELEMGYEVIFDKYFTYGDLNAKRVVGKTAGAYVHKNTIERIYQNNPDCHIVLIARNPVDRAYSNYTFDFSHGRQTRPFREIVNELINDTLDIKTWELLFQKGQYAYFLENSIFPYFPMERVNIVRFEDLKKDPVKVAQSLYKLLEIDDTFAPSTSKTHHKTRVPKSQFISIFFTKLKRMDGMNRFLKKVIPLKYYTKIGWGILNMNLSKDTFKPMDKDLRQLLVDYYKPHNRKLEELTGMDFSNWDKVG